jgi:hypothetical protein
MISMLDSAISGLTRAETSATAAAVDVSHAGEGVPPEPDVASDFVTLSVSGAEVAVSCKVATAFQQDDKALLDIVA